MEALSLAAEVWGLCTSNLSPADCPHCGTFHRSLRTACTLLWSQPSWKMHKVCSAGMELEDGESPSLGAVSILSTLFQSSVSRATWQTLGQSDRLLRLLMFTSQSNLSRNPDLLIHSVISKESSVPRWWYKSNFIVCFHIWLHPAHRQNPPDFQLLTPYVCPSFSVPLLCLPVTLTNSIDPARR